MSSLILVAGGSQASGGGGGGSGTVTSVGLTAPAALLSVSGSPVTGAGTLALSLATSTTPNLLLATAVSGNASTALALRALVANDIPGTLNATAAPTFSTTGVGTVSAPSFQINSAGTGVLGFYSAGAINQTYQALALAQNGAQVLTVDTAGGALQWNAKGGAAAGFSFYANGTLVAQVLSGNGLVVRNGGIAASPAGQNATGGEIRYDGADTHNAQGRFYGTTQVTASMSGATVSLAGAIPAGAIVLGVAARVTTAITGATTFNIGDGTTATAFGSGIATALNTTTTNANWTLTTTPVYPSGANIVLTSVGGSFTAGVVRVAVYYAFCNPPTS